MTTKPEDKAFTQADMDAAIAAAVATATETARKDGAKAEQDRRAAIMGCDAAKTRPVAAAAFVAKGLDAETATSLLGDMPEEKAGTTTTTTTPAPAAGSTPFDEHMDATGNPEVGAAGPAGDAGMDDDQKATASIVGAVRAYHGTKPKAA